jgi:hypothetical protein
MSAKRENGLCKQRQKLARLAARCGRDARGPSKSLELSGLAFGGCFAFAGGCFAFGFNFLR